MTTNKNEIAERVLAGVIAAFGVLLTLRLSDEDLGRAMNSLVAHSVITGAGAGLNDSEVAALLDSVLARLERHSDPRLPAFAARVRGLVGRTADRAN